MKKFQSLILAILCSTSIALATTYTGTTGDCTYTLDTSDSTLVISGSGAMEDYSSASSVPWHSYRSYVKSVTIENGVTSICNYAFYYYSSLTSITIPDAVTSIGEGAFYKCTSLSSVTIGSGVTSIGDNAFYNCESLMSIKIPSKVTSIGDYAFTGCSDLVKIISLASTPPTIGENTFSDQYSSATLFAASTKYTTADYWSNFTTIISEETTITGACGDNLTYTLTISTDGSTSFSIEGSGKMYDFVETADMSWYTYRNAITSVSLPSELTTIGDFAFRNCTFLASITIPDGVTTIGDYAFYDCSSLTSINIPDGVTSIDNHTFYNCSSLTSINIPDGVTSFGKYAFYNCSSLTSINIPDGVTSIDDYTFL